MLHNLSWKFGKLACSGVRISNVVRGLMWCCGFFCCPHKKRSKRLSKSGDHSLCMFSEELRAGACDICKRECPQFLSQTSHEVWVELCMGYPGAERSQQGFFPTLLYALAFKCASYTSFQTFLPLLFFRLRSIRKIFVMVFHYHGHSGKVILMLTVQE